MGTFGNEDPKSKLFSLTLKFHKTERALGRPRGEAQLPGLSPALVHVMENNAAPVRNGHQIT